MNEQIVSSILITTVLFGVFFTGFIGFYYETVRLGERTLSETESSFGENLNNTAVATSHIKDQENEFRTNTWDDVNIVAYTLEMIFSGRIIEDILDAGGNLLTIIGATIGAVPGLESNYLINAIGTIFTISLVGMVIYVIYKVRT